MLSLRYDILSEIVPLILMVIPVNPLYGLYPLCLGLVTPVNPFISTWVIIDIIYRLKLYPLYWWLFL